MPPLMPPLKISEDRYITISMGAIWAMAGAMFVGLGLLCVGIRQGQQFIDSFGEFRKSTLAYENAAAFDRKVVNNKLTNITAWQNAADERRKIRSPFVVDAASLDDWGRTVQDENSDIVHTDPNRHGLSMPRIVIKPVLGLPEAIVIPPPVAPVNLDSIEN